ncbi:MAG TPA: hypothetical protein VK539_07105 [Myxococcaceae bacterium]|nr:hypothetical protein [Myxococcaceae bacterium]
MATELTADALRQLLHDYYPAGLWPDDPAYKSSEQAQRLTQHLASAQQDTLTWKGFIQQVANEFHDCLRWDTTLLWNEPCYRLRVSLPGVVVGGGHHDETICLLSVLAPAYVIYAAHWLDTGPFKEAWTRYPPLPTEFQAHEARLAKLLESTMGASRLSNSVLFTPIPELAPRTGNVALGKALLIDLLFTVDRW